MKRYLFNFNSPVHPHYTPSLPIDSMPAASLFSYMLRLYFGVSNRLHNCTNEGGGHCEHMCWDGGYSRKWNQKYSHFFCHFLNYCADNFPCNCFWAETNLKAVKINNKVYKFIKNLCDDELIDPSFSPYWCANEICFD